MNKKYYVIKLPHGWFKGKIKMADIIDTIDAGINNWHTLIGETNETQQRERVLIKNATKKGYLEAELYDGIDISSRMHKHRGTVQKGMAQTLTTSCDVGVLVYETD